MVEKIRFHMDENVDGAIAEGLRKQGLNVGAALLERRD
jgi:hypothetical protein